MEFYRHNWYFVGGIVFVFMALFMGLWGTSYFSEIQVILIYSFMGMLFHQFEEYGWPGGFPGLSNIIFNSTEALDRYPLNAQTAMINNVFMTYTFYILAIIFPGAIWYGLIQVGQGMAQIINHGFTNNIKIKRFYNPGMFSTILWQWPVGIYYIWYVYTNGMAVTTDFIIGFFGSLASLFILWLGPVYLLRNKNSKHPFNPNERYRYGADIVRAAEQSLKDTKLQGSQK